MRSANANKAAARTNTAPTGAPGESHGIVRLRDVASVVNGVEDIHTGGNFNGKPAILVIVFKTAEANVIDTVDKRAGDSAVSAGLDSSSCAVHVALDRTTTIRASVKDVTRTMMISIVLVILVVFVFLRELRPTLIPSVSVPLSILGTFGIMYLLGYTLDNLSLMALTISTGFVVDDAIVVIENITRHLESGKSPFDAAMIGSKEIGFTVLSMSTSLVAVFIPILLMGGIVGRLFREFAVTLSGAIVMSLLVSLTTTPMLSAKFLKAHSENHNFFYRLGERALARLKKEYTRGLRWVLRRQALVLTITVLTFVLNVYLFILIPKGFFPQQDTGRIGGQIRGQQDVSFEALAPKIAELAAIVQKDPAVENVMSFAGGGGSVDTGRMFVSLKPDAARAEAGDSADVIINRLRPKSGQFPERSCICRRSRRSASGGV